MAQFIERFLVHFICSTSLTLAAFFALRYWISHNTKVGIFLSARKSHLIISSALIVWGLSVLREPYDILAGNQLWYKAIFDQLSWTLGLGITAWGLYRFGGKNGA